MFKKLSYKKQEKVIVFLFLLIPLIFLVVFTFLPALYMFRLSFVEWNGFSGVKKWVGFANYIEIFKNPDYFKPLLNSLYYFFGGLVQLALAFYLAVLLNSKIKGKSIFKALYFFPFLLNGVAVSLIFIFFFRPGSTLDTVLNMFGLSGLTKLWLQDTGTNNICLAFVSVWRYIGYNIVMFSAAMASISSDILEASRVDGANKFQQLRHIILPGISTILGLQLFLSITGALSAFETPYIMTGGGNGTMTFIIQTVQFAFQNHRVGLASAMAMVLLLLCIIVTSIQNYVMNKKAR